MLIRQEERKLKQAEVPQELRHVNPLRAEKKEVHSRLKNYALRREQHGGDNEKD
jgi:hypothetical protein